MIPRSQYLITEDDIIYITWDLIDSFHTEKEVNQFSSFMSGQTMCMGDDGKAMIYVQDYERWLKKNKTDENDGWD
jgi:hypothetical protein